MPVESSNDLELPEPHRSRPVHPAVWLVLIGVVVVGLALFRRTGRPEVEPVLSSGAPLLRSLEKTVSLDYAEHPLKDVLAELVRQLDVPVHIDAPGIRDEGVPLDQPVTIRGKGISGRAALHLLLSPLQLDAVIQDEVLYITTVSRCAEVLDTLIYEVADLVAIRDATGAVGFDMAPLVDALKWTIEPESWIDTGGQGSISEFDTGGIHALLVRQTQSVHRQIEAMLANLRRNRRTSMPNSVRATLPERGREITRELASTRAVGALPPGQLSNSRMEALVRGNNQFALELYAKLARESTGNVFLSPLGISNALAILYAGAGGETAHEIEQVQHFLIRQSDLPQAYVAYRASLFHNLQPVSGSEGIGHMLVMLNNPQRLSAPQGIELTCANRLWTQEGLEILQPFRFATELEYGAELATLDFSDRAGAVAAINAWADKATNGTIQRLLAEEDLPDPTSFVVTNAVTFDGRWTKPFPVSSTAPALFSTGTSQIEVDMMHNVSDQCRYAAIDGVQILDKPYGRGECSLLILLPENSPAALAELESKLSETTLLRWLAATETQFPEVFLPRFRVEFEIELREVLRSLGMTRAFDLSKADFSGMCAGGQLALWKIIHKAFVEVDEAGTRAAAATGGGGFGGSYEPVVFRADHPFVLIIRDNRTGSILFMGRLVVPGGG